MSSHRQSDPRRIWGSEHPDRRSHEDGGSLRRRYSSRPRDLPYRHVFPITKRRSAERYENTAVSKQDLIDKHNREIRDRPAVTQTTSVEKRVRFRLPTSPPLVKYPKRPDKILEQPRRCRLCGHILE